MNQKESNLANPIINTIWMPLSSATINDKNIFHTYNPYGIIETTLSDNMFEQLDNKLNSYPRFVPIRPATM